MAQHIPYHPSPGIRGLMPGWVKLPVLVNPVTYVAPSSGGSGPSAGSGGTIGVDSAGNLVPTFGAANVQPGLGAFMAARFPVPQNPVLDYIRKGPMSGMSCGGGMGQLTMPTFDFTWADITAGTAGWATYAALGVGALALVWMFGGGMGKYHGARASYSERKGKTALAKAAYYRSMAGN